MANQRLALAVAITKLSFVSTGTYLWLLLLARPSVKHSVNQQYQNKMEILVGMNA